MKKRLLAALLTSALALSLTACGGGTDSSATDGGNTASTHDGPYKISMVLKTNAAEFWNIVQAGAEAYEDEHPDQVSLDIKGPPAETYYEEQLNTIQTDLAVESYDGYLIAPLQSEAVATAIANTDKPVVAYDTRIDSDKCLAFVGTGNKEAAKEGGKAAVEAAKKAGWDKITAIGIMGVQGDSTSEARIAGFKQGIAEAGGEYLSAETQYADSVADKAVTCMEAIIQAHPEGVSIIVANNDDMAAGAARAAAAFPAYKNTIFVGIGGNLAGIDAILAGQETMTVAVDGYDVGYLGVQAAVDALNGKKLDEFIATDATVVTADNAAERRAEVEKRLGTS